MHKLVPTQFSTVCKGHVTRVTGIRPVSAVDSLMSHQTVQLLKSSAAYVTAVRVSEIAPTSAEAQMTMYLNLCSQQRASEDCLEFLRKHESDLNKLYRLAMTVLSVPATSAAVERVFSHGGLIIKPHRARMSDKLLSNLIF